MMAKKCFILADHIPYICCVLLSQVIFVFQLFIYFYLKDKNIKLFKKSHDIILKLSK